MIMMRFHCGNSITIILIIMVENGLFYDTLCFHFVNACHFFSWDMCPLWHIIMAFHNIHFDVHVVIWVKNLIGSLVS